MTSPASSAQLRGTPWIALVAVLAVALFGAAAWAAEEGKRGDLEVAVSGLETDRGALQVALMNSADAFENDGEAFRGETAPVKDGKASVTFRDLPYGSYAVKVFHDENSNGKLDTNFVGFPKEGFGFSNDAMGRFGPPSFEQAMLEIDSLRLQIVIHAK